ncbi:TAP42-like protein [Fistulina hepatica ATCC 64428]|nr:TAP42-like protein [Fistulina hepatica ATCC 64428]
MDEDISPAQLFHRALKAASEAQSLPTADDATQDLIRASLSDLRTLYLRIHDLSLFSPNETIDDISTRNLVYLLVPYVLVDVQGRVRTFEPYERVATLNSAQRYLDDFLSLLTNYDVIPEAERILWGKSGSDIPNPAARRELKIKQYKTEKDIRARIETLRKRRRQSQEKDSPSDMDMISSLLHTSDGDEDEDAETAELSRETTLLLIRLCFAQACATQESMKQELELLRNAPPPKPPSAALEADVRDRRRQQTEDMWRLDAPRPSDGPLLDANGRPLRPFTILGSNAVDRTRLQAQVFRPGYNLPTMSVDELLEIERQRGRFISGGGPASENAPTSSEQLAMDAEMDGTAFGEVKVEEKRLKDEKWAQYTDTHTRGAGNTMNRG